MHLFHQHGQSSQVSHISVHSQADHNNMRSLSKQHEKTKMEDSMVHFQGCMLRDPSRIVWRLEHKKHRTLAPFVQSPTSISLFGNFKT